MGSGPTTDFLDKQKDVRVIGSEHITGTFFCGDPTGNCPRLSPLQRLGLGTASPCGLLGCVPEGSVNEKQPTSGTRGWGFRMRA